MSQNIYADPIGKAFNKLYDGVLDIFAPLGENEVRNIDLWLNKISKDEYNYYSNKGQTNNLSQCEDKDSFDAQPVWSNCYGGYVLSKDFREYYVGELQNNLMHGFGVGTFDKMEESWKEECFMNKILDGSFDDRVFNLYKNARNVVYIRAESKEVILNFATLIGVLVFLKTDFLQNCICMSEIGNQESVMVKGKLYKDCEIKIKLNIILEI